MDQRLLEQLSYEDYVRFDPLLEQFVAVSDSSFALVHLGAEPRVTFVARCYDSDGTLKDEQRLEVGLGAGSGWQRLESSINNYLMALRHERFEFVPGCDCDRCDLKRAGDAEESEEDEIAATYEDIIAIRRSQQGG